MSRSTLLTAGLVALGGACLLGLLVAAGGADPGVLDVWWNDFFVQNRRDLVVAFAQVMNVVGGGWVATLVVPLGIAALLLLLRRPRAALFAVVTFAASAALVQTLKSLFGRARPEDLLVASDFGSFPSGHTANAATVALVLWLLFPRVWVAVCGAAWVVLMAFSRVVLAVHWASDTLGGALVGTASALLLAAILLPWVRAESPPAVSTESVLSIRPFRRGDLPALREVCVRTADAGADAQGLLSDDDLWGNIFAVPYVVRHPDLAWVVQSRDGRVVGYVVATDDTDTFERWFREEWWPQFADRHPRPASARSPEEDLIEYAYARGAVPSPHAREFPAHLHIDLLPDAQGQGWGRRLTQTLFDELRRRGVPGLHLSMNPRNAGAAAFYERLGMELLSSTESERTFGVRFDGR